MPVSTTGQLQDVLLVDRVDVVVIAHEPGLALLSDPAHVVAAVAGPPLVSQDRLEDVVATVAAALVVREAGGLVFSVVLGLALRLLRLGPVLTLHPGGLQT